MSSEEHLCSHCKKNLSSITLLIRSQGYLRNLFLCENCCNKYNLNHSGIEGNYLMDIFLDFFASQNHEEKKNPSKFEHMTCSYCNTTFKDIISKGTYGCFKCIYHFKNLFDKYFLRTQKKNYHIGLTPRKHQETHKNYQMVCFLKELLAENVQFDNFLRARRIKHQIIIIEKKLSDASPTRI